MCLEILLGLAAANAASSFLEGVADSQGMHETSAASYYTRSALTLGVGTCAEYAVGSALGDYSAYSIGSRLGSSYGSYSGSSYRYSGSSYR